MIASKGSSIALIEHGLSVMKNEAVLIFALVSFAVVDPAWADVTCTGHIDRVATSATGRVSIIATELFGDGNGRDICNVGNASNGIGVTTCQSWLAKVLAAKTAGGTISIQYTNGSLCSAIPAWDGAYAPWAIFMN